MFNKSIKLKVGIIVGAILMTTVSVDMFMNTNDKTEYIAGVSESFSAGAHAAMDETVVLNDTGSNLLLANVTEQDVPVVAEPMNPYENIAIAQVSESLNIRAEANEEAEVLGKLYANGAGTVLETLDGWYKIESGSVVGYVSADYVVVGDEEACKAASDRIATVVTETLKLREEASTESAVQTLVSGEQKMTVLDESIEGWVKVEFKSYVGYVSADYVELKTVYSHAESKEEEEARLAAEEEARRREEEAAARKAAEQQASAQKAAAAAKTYNPPSGGSGQDVVNYAVQFVGNPYVSGGTSLTNGADCSGFVKSVYQAFGVSLPRTSYEQRNAGYEVSASDIQPGDIVCYSGHVAIYIGNGQIVHASNPSDGIKISSNWQYKSVITIRRIY